MTSGWKNSFNKIPKTLNIYKIINKFDNMKVNNLRLPKDTFKGVKCQAT